MKIGTRATQRVSDFRDGATLEAVGQQNGIAAVAIPISSYDVIRQAGAYANTKVVAFVAGLGLLHTSIPYLVQVFS
jgi:hypothetical protein